MDSVSDFLSRLLTPESGALTLGHAFVAVLIAYVGGVLSSLTPCVYPMIPITVGVVGGMSHKGESRPWRDILFRAGAYILGMTLIYSFLGVAAGLTGKIFGTLTNTAGWYLGLGIVLTFAALVMLEIVPFDPAVWFELLKRRLRGKSTSHLHASPVVKREMTLLGAFALGASSGFIAAPCTTPVLSAILAYVARTQSIGLGLALMVGFSLGLGTLLLTIAAFTGALQMLPRSGRWMRAIKVGSGLILLAFGEYLIYRAGAAGGN
jgi:thiol:disulfide interchange protein DsbD